MVGVSEEGVFVANLSSVSICLSICLSVCLSVCISICLSVCLKYAHHLHYMCSAACQSEHSSHYCHLDSISNSFSIHCLSSHMLLAAEKRFGVAL